MKRNVEQKLAVTRLHMRFLLYWGLANCVLSGLGLMRKKKQRYFHEHNLLWNLVTIATYAGLRRYLVRGLYASVSDRPDTSTNSTTGDLLQRTRSALIFSLGLDLGLYPYGGGLLRVLGDLQDSERLRRYGRSMWLQGLVHITNSLLWLRGLSGLETPNAADGSSKRKDKKEKKA